MEILKRRLYILLAVMLCVCSAYAQKSLDAKTLDGSSASSKNRFFDGLSVGVDLVGPILYQISSYGDYQAYLQANIKGKYLPIVELGYGRSNKSYEITDITYKTKAPFGRIGCDVNLLKNKHDKYRATIGLRYGVTSFDYDTTAPTDSLHTQFSTSSEKCTLHWAELAFGVDAKIWGPVHMGWSFRYRKRLHISDYVHDPLYAPGFGNASEGTSLMALYTVSLEI